MTDDSKADPEESETTIRRSDPDDQSADGQDDQPAGGQGQPGGGQDDQPTGGQGGQPSGGQSGQPGGQGGQGPAPGGQSGQPGGQGGQGPAPGGQAASATAGQSSHNDSATETGGSQFGSADGNLVERFLARYAKASAVILVVLFVTTLPIISLIRLIPTFKELVLGAVVVAAFTPIVDRTEGAKYALIAGMVAAVVFNVVNIPLQIVLSGLLSAGTAASGQAGGAAAAGGLLGGLGALSNLIGLIIFSPVGYAIGGVVGTFLNE